MKNKANPAVIGAFVVGGLVLAIVGVLVFGSGRFLAKSNPCVMYFDESIAGLDVGAPVEFRGVKVGRVSGMNLLYDHSTEEFKIPVYIEMDEGVVEEVGGVSDTAQQDLAVLVERGLKARLESAGLVTGKLKVALDFYPEAEARFLGDGGDIPEIPTVPGALEAVVRVLRELPITQIVEDAHRAVKGAADLIQSEEAQRAVADVADAATAVSSLVRTLQVHIDPTAESLRTTMGSVQEMATTVGENVDAVAESFRATAAAAAVSMETAAKTLKEIERTLDPDSPVRHEIIRLLTEIADASRSIRLFLEFLERDPNALIRGKSAR